VSLLVGPTSVGKTTLAFEVLREHEITGADVIRSRDLTVDSARRIMHDSHVAPVGHTRVFMIDLDGASYAALSVLLKTLEEAPPTTRFILIASEMPPETIASRCDILRFPLLTTAEVEEILLRKKFSPGVASNLARLSGGQVSTALMHAEGSEAKVVVLAALRALQERDEDALDNLASRWEEQHTELLAQLCREALTQRWKVFQAAEVEGLRSKVALDILVKLRANIRPRLVIHASLMSVLKESA